MALTKVDKPNQISESNCITLILYSALAFSGLLSMHCYGITLEYLFHPLGYFEPKTPMMVSSALFWLVSNSSSSSDASFRHLLKLAGGVGGSETSFFGAEARPEQGAGLWGPNIASS